MGLEGVLGATSLVAASLLVGCGYVDIGEDLSPLEAGVRDGESADAAPPDATGDAGVEDATVLDADCTPPAVTPEFRRDWPFPATKEAYLREFADPMANLALCAACHPQERTLSIHKEPFIPQNNSPALDDPGLLARALREIWATAQPAASGDPAMILAHTVQAVETGLSYTPAQTDALRRLIKRGDDCRWVGVTVGAGECAPPATDHCAPRP